MILRTGISLIEVDAAAYLNEYLMLLNHGSVIVGVSADEARNNLQAALTQLRHLGADVADVKHRGSFAFVAQKGYPRKTVLRKVLTEERSNINPAHFIASVNGMHSRPIKAVCLGVWVYGKSDSH